MVQLLWNASKWKKELFLTLYPFSVCPWGEGKGEGGEGWNKARPVNPNPFPLCKDVAIDSSQPLTGKKSAIST